MIRNTYSYRHVSFIGYSPLKTIKRGEQTKEEHRRRRRDYIKLQLSEPVEVGWHVYYGINELLSLAAVRNYPIGIAF